MDITEHPEIPRVCASNGTIINLELPDPNEEDTLCPDNIGICTYPLELLCAEVWRPCNKCPHCERFWP